MTEIMLIEFDYSNKDDRIIVDLIKNQCKRHKLKYAYAGEWNEE